MNKAFTLIELLVTMGIIAILAGISIVAINPTKQFADANNAQRINDINGIQAAMQQYIIDNKGSLPPGVDTTERQLGTCGSGGNSGCSGAASTCLDLSTPLAKYMPKIPQDPTKGSASTTFYSVVTNANNIITVKACGAELGEIIEIAR